MRKYLVFMIPILVMLFSVNVKAESYTAPNGNSYYVKYTLQNDLSYQNQHFKADYYVNQYIGVYNNLPYIWVNGARKQLVMFPYNAGTYTFTENTIASGQASENTKLLRYQTGSGSNVTYTTIDSCVYVNPGATGFTLQFNSGNYGYTSSTFPVFQNTTDLDNYISQPAIQIEWNQPEYNPNMPIPEFSTNYGEISVNSSSPEIPFDITFVNPNNDYYIEIWCDYWIPDNMSISINRGMQYNDGYVYKALSRDLVYNYLIDPEQMLRIQGINNLKLQLKTNWENALTQVPVSALEYANPNNLPSGMFTQYKNTYENYCRNILGFYGSQFTIMMRYFTIVNDTQYVVGAWRTWTTYSPNEFTERLPDYYVPYVPASGQENITNNVDPENVEIVQGTGSTTGAISDPNYYITVNQNTPNYPDYPTIASYNKDNLLLDTMNHINSLSTFFGDFGDFLTTSFAFFPSWIWAIIGAGFGISIVVMFLKIL